MTSYALLSSNILSDIEQQLTQGRLKEIGELKELNHLIKDEHSIMQESYTVMIAEREQKIEKLNAEMKILEFKNSSLINAVESLNRELQKTTRNMVEIQQKNVELCLQCAEYKADVDHSNEKITRCIQSKMGYIPTTVLRYIVYLRQLKVIIIFCTISSYSHLILISFMYFICIVTRRSFLSSFQGITVAKYSSSQTIFFHFFFCWQQYKWSYYQ